MKTVRGGLQQSLFKPEKISSQAKIIKSIISGYSLVADKIRNSHFSDESIFKITATNLTLLPIIKGSEDFSENIKRDHVCKQICDKYKLPFPANSTYLSSCISLSYNRKIRVIGN